MEVALSERKRSALKLAKTCFSIPDWNFIARVRGARFSEGCIMEIVRSHV